MFRPSLKRSTFDKNSSIRSEKTHKKYQKLPKNIDSPRKDVQIIPALFFQDCRQEFFHNDNAEPMHGAINTLQYSYPKEVQKLIIDNDPGHIQLHQDIFCYYKQDTLYLWRYFNNNLLNPKKILKHTFDGPITAIKIITLKELDYFGKPILLLAIATGYRIKLYSINNFQLEIYSVLPDIQNLFMIITARDVIVKLQIFKIPYGGNGESNIIMLLGDASGGLLIFNFKTKKKYQIDSWFSSLKKKFYSSDQTIFKQVLLINNFLITLTQKYLKVDSFIRKCQKIFRIAKDFESTEQKITIYKLNSSSNVNQSQSQRLQINILGHSLYKQIKSRELFEKLRSSFFVPLDPKQISHEKTDFLHVIESISHEDQYINVLFKSGQSILLDEELSFVEKPQNSFNIASKFNLCTLSSDQGDEHQIKEKLLCGYGNKIQIFQNSIVARDQEQITYITPFKNQLVLPFQTSIWEYRRQNDISSGKNQFILFTKKSIIFIEKLTKLKILKLYAAIYSSDLAGTNEELLPQKKYFDAKISELIKYWGQTQVIYYALKILTNKIKYQKQQIYLRQDIFENIENQLALSTKSSWSEALTKFKSVENSPYKIKLLEFGKHFDSVIWKIVLQYGNTKKNIQRMYGSQVNKIEALCAAFQILISSTYEQVSYWSCKNFCFKRKQIYQIIASSQIYRKLMGRYIKQQLLQLSQAQRKPAQQLGMYSDFFEKHRSVYLYGNPKSKSPQIRFCELCMLVLNKLITLLKLYQFLSEINLQNSQFPSFYTLIFSTNEDVKLQFTSQIVSILENNNNQVLMDLISETLPQLNLPLIRRYQTWKSITIDNPLPSHNKINETSDSLFSEDIQQITELLTPYTYPTFFNYFLEIKPPKTEDNNEKISNQDSQHYRNQAITIFLATMIKINGLRSQQVNLNNILAKTQSSQNQYFAVLEIPAIIASLDRVMKHRQFYLNNCKQIIVDIFKKFEKQIFDKIDIQQILNRVRREVPVELRKKIIENLSKYKIEQLSNIITERQIFSTGTIVTQKIKNTSNLMSRQICYENLTFK